VRPTPSGLDISMALYPPQEQQRAEAALADEAALPTVEMLWEAPIEEPEGPTRGLPNRKYYGRLGGTLSLRVERPLAGDEPDLAHSTGDHDPALGRRSEPSIDIYHAR